MSNKVSKATLAMYMRSAVEQVAALSLTKAYTPADIALLEELRIAARALLHEVDVFTADLSAECRLKKTRAKKISTNEDLP
jgi:hypothetical protein